MKEAIVSKEVKIPDTGIILEPGDKIIVYESEKESVEVKEGKARDLKFLIGKDITYGSPGYPMDFKVTDIEDNRKGWLELIGIMNGEDGNFFRIPYSQIDELINTGETHYDDPVGGGYVSVFIEKTSQKPYIEAVDIKKIIKDLQGDFGGDNASQMKGVQLLKGLATSEDPLSNKFMKALNTAMTKISKEVLE